MIQKKVSNTAATPDRAVPADGNTQKDPSTWVTGNEPMTGAQRAYLHTLSQETGQQIPEDLTKGQASEKIDELRKVDPRVSGEK